jgi:hypothetical protein
MRLRPVLFAFLAAATLAWSAQAQTTTTPEEARDLYQSELGRQCPDKHLEMLSQRDLRDGLDQYMQGLPDDVRATLQRSETAHCSSQDAGVSCVNLADVAAANDLGRMQEMVQSVCASFLRCRDEGVCDYAR